MIEEFVRIYIIRLTLSPSFISCIASVLQMPNKQKIKINRNDTPDQIKRIDFDLTSL